MSKTEKDKAKNEKTAEESKEELEELKEETCEEGNKDSQHENEESPEQKLKKELDSQKDLYLRLAAEYDNYRKRTTNEKASIYSDATARAVSEILTVADSLTMAVKAAESAPDEFKKGIELVDAQMKTALEKLNVEGFGAVEEEFNPDLHNAVSTVDDENLGKNVIAQVFQKGYKIGDKIIRHAMVQVANCG